MTVIAWARERLANTRRIADEKTGADRAGWLEDVKYWEGIVSALDVFGSLVLESALLARTAEDYDSAFARFKCCAAPHNGWMGDALRMQFAGVMLRRVGRTYGDLLADIAPDPTQTLMGFPIVTVDSFDKARGDDQAVAVVVCDVHGNALPVAGYRLTPYAESLFNEPKG